MAHKLPIDGVDCKSFDFMPCGRVTYICKDYRPDMVRKRYVRYAGAYEWHWCEVGDDRRYDIRQGVSSDMRDFPFQIADAAINLKLDGVIPSWVEWPLGFVGMDCPINIPAPPI